MYIFERFWGLSPPGTGASFYTAGGKVPFDPAGQTGFVGSWAEGGPAATWERREMLTDDQLMGIRKRNMSELKEIKVKLPVQYLINLHYLKLTQSQGISDVVTQALTEYFTAQSLPLNKKGQEVQ